MKHVGDITKLDGTKLPIVDVITGGSPCQDLSIAGKRAGLAGERSGLFMEQIRIIKEMRDESIRQLRMRGADDTGGVLPRFMVWENVCGAFSSHKGADFQAVLEETVKVVDQDAVIPKFTEGGRDGQTLDVSWETDGQSLGEYMMPNTGEFLKGENAYVYLLISTGTQPERFYLNCSETPMQFMESRLSWVLENNPDPKYNLSAKACQGILRRAESRGKILPEQLDIALRIQAGLPLMSGSVLTELKIGERMPIPQISAEP